MSVWCYLLDSHKLINIKFQLSKSIYRFWNNLNNLCYPSQGFSDQGISDKFLTKDKLSEVIRWSLLGQWSFSPMDKNMLGIIEKIDLEKISYSILFENKYLNQESIKSSTCRM